MRAIEYEDILNIDQSKMVTISLDGKSIAWIITKSDIDKNCIYDELYCWSAELSVPVKLLRSEKIIQIKWNKDSLYLILKENNKYKIICIENGKINELITSKNFISSFEISRDKPVLFFSQIISTSLDECKKRKEEGYIYRWGSDNMTTLTQRRYGHFEYEKIWQYDISTRKKIFLAKVNYNGWLDTEPLISKLILSLNEDYLAVQYNKIGDVEIGESPFIEDILVINLKTKKLIPFLPALPHSKKNACWIGDAEIIFQNRNYANEEFVLCSYNFQNNTDQKIKIDDLDADINSLTWNNEQRHLVAINDKNIYTISLDPIKFVKGGIDISFSSSFNCDAQINFLAGVREDLNQLPQIVRYDLKNHQTKIISSLNLQVEEMLLGEVEEISIQTNTGLSTNGYLLYPIVRNKNTRYPLIIATYGFHGKTHKANIQEWHTTFPAQILAREGYVVLLLNDVGGFSQTYVDDAKKARDEEGWNALEVFEHAVTLLNQKGLIDPERVGLYGWSHGAFIVEFLISHSNKFQAASIGEGGDYNPGCFWLTGMQQWTKIFNNVFGGPPWGETLKNYFDFSPFFQIDKIKTPLLMEFSQAASCVGLEMYSPLRYLKTPVELVIYDDEEHNFIKPKARLASMARKVEWFNYWLLDKKELKKESQYHRWDKMRDLFQFNDD